MSIFFNINFGFGKRKSTDREAKQAKQAAAALPVQRTPEAQAGKTEADYTDWILEHLPADLPDYAKPGYALSSVERLEGWVRGLEFWVPGDRGPDRLEYTATSEEELRYWLFRRECVCVAQRMELRTRCQDELRYRYVMDHVEDGRWIYRQNPGYEYNTIHDSRKAWMEQALRMTLPVLPSQEWEALAVKYEQLFNNHYRTPHWGYDSESGVFREIGDSPWLDWKGVEQPAPGTVIGVDHP